MIETEPPLGLYEFGSFRLDVVERSLWHRQDRVPLGGRALDVLAALVRQAGRLVTKDELLRQAWKGRVVEEGNIHVQISSLRKLLGDKAIATVSGYGYRFELPLGRGDIATANESNLPAALTPLVARGQELAELGELMSRQRLVTIKGMGGIGKSRVAIETCRLVQRTSPTLRCWHVPVGPTEQGGSLQSTVLHSVGRRPNPPNDIATTLVAILREKPTILLLDGCEMIAEDDARAVRSMLEQCPELKILCTSRRSLGLVGEAIYELPTLSLEDAKALFLERAASASSSFKASKVDTQLLERILEQLDGIPLAIELASSRLRAVGMKELEQQLSDRLNTLVGSDRSLPTRQSTLRATLEWSYRLLTEDERNFFNRLCIFKAPFTVEAAAYVGLGPTSPLGAAIELLTGLIDKSLVMPTFKQDVNGYRVTEIVREYGLQQLGDSDQISEVRDIVASYSIVRTRDFYNRREWRSDEKFVRDGLLPYKDLLASIQYLIETGKLNQAADLSHNLFFVWMDLGLWADGLQVIQPIIAQASKIKPASRAKLFHVAGGLYQDQGQFEASKKHLASATQLLKASVESPDLQGIVLNDFGVTCQYLGKHSEALDAYNKACQIFQKRALARREAVCLTNIAALDCYLDNFGKAREKLERARRVYMAMDDKRGLAVCTSWLSECHIESGDFGPALSLAKQAIAYHPPKGDEMLSVSLLNRLAVAEVFNDLIEAGKRSWLLSLASLGARENQRALVDLLEGALIILIKCNRLEVAAKFHHTLKCIKEGRKDLASPVRLRREIVREERLAAALGREMIQLAAHADTKLNLREALEGLRKEIAR